MKVTADQSETPLLKRLLNALTGTMSDVSDSIEAHSKQSEKQVQLVVNAIKENQPTVTVEPQINVPPVKRCSWEFVIERDKDRQISKITATPKL